MPLYLILLQCEMCWHPKTSNDVTFQIYMYGSVDFFSRGIFSSFLNLHDIQSKRRFTFWRTKNSCVECTDPIQWRHVSNFALKGYQIVTFYTILTCQLFCYPQILSCLYMWVWCDSKIKPHPPRTCWLQRSSEAHWKYIDHSFLSRFMQEIRMHTILTSSHRMMCKPANFCWDGQSVSVYTRMHIFVCFAGRLVNMPRVYTTV